MLKNYLELNSGITMLGQLRTIGYLAVLVSLSFAELPGDKCSKDGDMLGITNECKEYLICEKGQYVSKSCGIWQEFDVKYNECRWSPLATCRQKTLDDTVLDDVTEMICSESGPCRSSRDSTGVVDQCQYYCTCKDGVFQQPKKCLLDNYYDPIRKLCTSDSTICQNTPMTQEPTTVTGSEPTTVTGSEPTTVTGSEPITVTGSEPTTVTGSESTTVTGSEPSTSVTSSETTSSPPVSDCDTPGKKIPDKKNCYWYFECTASKDKKTNTWVHEKCSYFKYYDTAKEGCAFNIATKWSFPWLYRPCQ